MNLTYTDTSIGYQHGQTDMILTAYLDGKEVGTINYSIYEGEPNIKMLEVNKEYRRMGIGTKMVKHLQKLFPDQEINIGMLTPDGSKLAQTINRTFKDNPQYKKTKDHYEQVKSEIQRIMSKMDKGDYSEADKLNDLHDQEYELGEKLADMKTGKYFIERRNMRSSKLNLLVERLVREEIDKSLLNEATLNLDEDVDYIFEKAFKQFYTDLFAGKKPNEHEINSNKAEVVFATLDSSELPSATSKKADSVNPVTIYCGIFDRSLYDPINNQISITISKVYLSYLYQGNTELNLQPSEREAFRSQTKSTSTIKSTIYHELSHWIRDSLHNSHITKMLNRVDVEKRAGKDIKSIVSKVKNQGLPDANMTNIEIDALIHNIKQFKRDVPDTEWNNLTFLQLIRKVPTISYLYDKLTDNYMSFYASSGDLRKPSWRKDWAKEYVKLLLKRMYKEGLLGDNMKRMKY